MKTVTVLTSCILLAMVIGCNSEKKTNETAKKITYPKTDKVAQTDDYFGTKVEDPYRWLEFDTAANVKSWVEEQNKTTQDFLKAIPFRDKIKKRITELVNYPKFSSPFKAGNYF